MADKKESSLGSEIKDWVISIAIAVVLALFIRHFVVELYLVDGPSMRPTLQNQERLVVNKFIYNLHDPEPVISWYSNIQKTLAVILSNV